MFSKMSTCLVVVPIHARVKPRAWGHFKQQPQRSFAREKRSAECAAFPAGWRPEGNPLAGWCSWRQTTTSLPRRTPDVRFAEKVYKKLRFEIAPRLLRVRFCSGGRVSGFWLVVFEDAHADKQGTRTAQKKDNCGILFPRAVCTVQAKNYALCLRNLSRYSAHASIMRRRSGKYSARL